MPSFSDALGGSNNTKPPSGGGGIGGFDDAQPAPEFSPIPPGIYKARVSSAGVTKTKAGVDAYSMRFTILEGDQANRVIPRMWVFSAKAMPYVKRDLAVFGLTTSAQLLSPYPPTGKEVIVRLIVALQRGDDGIERNDIKRVELLEVRDIPGSQFLINTEEVA
jgi:hypothetical protein